jgi:hypothetical protein
MLLLNLACACAGFYMNFDRNQNVTPKEVIFRQNLLKESPALNRIGFKITMKGYLACG